MRQEDIIRMTRESGKHQWPIEPDFLERFAALVSAAEREECARLCEEWFTPNLGTEIAAEIRNRK